jgi:hypothetical protein
VAAQELDKMWDGWMVSLSGSYEKTVELLEAGKAKEAREEFGARFVPTVKKLYTEAPKTYPVRFAKINDWCSWMKNLYTMSLTAEKALSGDDSAGSKKLLAGLRAHFYGLHRETETLRVNDWIYAFVTAAAKEKPSAEELKAVSKSIGTAQPSVKALANADAFSKARSEWLAQVSTILEDGRIDAGELKTLRTTSDGFYRAFGTQFE